MSARLQGKTAIITGAASGIGEAMARLFAQHGCNLVLGDIRTEAGEALAGELGECAQFLHCDVTQAHDVAALVARATSWRGRLDVLINNAGIVGAVGPVESVSVADWKRTIDVLLNSVFYGMKYGAEVMKRQRSGSIISTASVAGVQGGLGPTAYTAAKHGVIGLTRAMAAELSPFGVRVNALAPYSTVTPLVAKVYFDNYTDLDATESLLAANSPLRGRPGRAEDVAQAALWLASDDAGYTSGIVLTTDAGFTAGARPELPKFAVRDAALVESQGGARAASVTDPTT